MSDLVHALIEGNQLERIADALERIANSLESLADPDTSSIARRF